MPLRFDRFFHVATGHPPYAFQCRLACGEPSRTASGPEAKADRVETLTGGTGCASQLIDIPTGLGKTAAVVPLYPPKLNPTHL